MQTSTNSTKIYSIAFATLFMVAFSFAFAANTARASDFVDGGSVPFDDFGDYGGSVPFDSYSNTYTDVYPNTYTDVYPNTYTDVYPNSYSDYGYPGSSGWNSGFSSGFGGGGWYLGGGGSMGGGLTNTNVNTNTNTCTAGSCNTAINAPTTINAPIVTYPTQQQSYPVYTPTYQPPVYYPTTPVCNTCGCAGYAPCYQQRAPYVTLAAVPYTGLDLGPTGTVLYWSFLVLWCLLAAYLIAVKKVQNKIAALFVGSKAMAPAHTAHVASVHTEPKHETVVVKTTAHVEPQHAGIDPFILTQINRA